MKVVYELSESHISDLQKLYQNEWWTETRTLEETRSAVNGSQVCIALLDEKDKLIGFARVLTDFTFKALIFDVIVAQQARKLGLGDLLIKQIKEYPGLAGIKHFELYCLPEMFSFYQKHGFSEQVGKIQLMRFSNN